MEDKKAKPTLLAIYKILCDYSDEFHPLKQKDIEDKLLEVYGIETSRNTIGNNIKILEDFFDLDICKATNGNGIYFNDRLITDAEMKFLSDAIYAYSAINGTYANDLVENLTKLFSVYNRDKYIHKRYSSEKIRKKDQDFLYKLDMIDTAINQKKKISYTTFTYDEHGKHKKAHFGHKNTASPYFTVSNMGKHYLIYNNDSYNNLSCTRIEFIDKDIEILDDDSVDIKKIDPSFNISEFMNSQNYMFSSNVVDAKIKLYNESAIKDAKDWFGENAMISYDCDNKEVFAKIKTDEQGLIYWALQYSDELEIVEPLKTRNRMEAFLKRASRNYEMNDKKVLDTIDFNTVLYDTLSSLRWFNNLDEVKAETIIKNIHDKINDFTSKIYKSSINNNSIILKSNIKDETIQINVNFLEGQATDDIYFGVLKNSKYNQDKITDNYKIIDVLISDDRSFYGSQKDLTLNNYFKVDYNASIEEIKYKDESVSFTKSFKAHWNPITKYADLKQYRFAVVIY